VILTQNKKLMGEFVNKRVTTLIAIASVGIILAFNTYLIVSTFSNLR
jgi:Mn2+/Fe2+ NRAMP family transporter